VKLLLDTHIWLWALLQPAKISLSVRRQLENPRNELYLSAISIWEAHHLQRRKRFRIKQGFSEWLDQVFLQVPVLEVPISFAVAAEAARLELPQADLGDLFLAATASVFDLTLVTADLQLLECDWLKTLPNA
jgi:PIN domain nuclease of toxin-antitoxin system